MKDYKRFLDECSIGDRKVVATASLAGSLQNVFENGLPASKSRICMAAVAASVAGIRWRNLGNTSLTNELTITVVKADAAELYELTAS